MYKKRLKDGSGTPRAGQGDVRMPEQVWNMIHYAVHGRTASRDNPSNTAGFMSISFLYDAVLLPPLV